MRCKSRATWLRRFGLPQHRRDDVVQEWARRVSELPVHPLGVQPEVLHRHNAVLGLRHCTEAIGRGIGGDDDPRRELLWRTGLAKALGKANMVGHATVACDNGRTGKYFRQETEDGGLAGTVLPNDQREAEPAKLLVRLGGNTQVQLANWPYPRSFTCSRRKGKPL
jgi:hypothetical protein